MKTESTNTSNVNGNNKGENPMKTESSTTHNNVNQGDNMATNENVNEPLNINLNNEGDSEMTSQHETTTNKGKNPMENQITSDNDANNGIANVANLINNAEEFKDPLDDLAERCAVVVGEAFRPEIIEELANLKKGDLSRFMSLRDRLKKAGCSLRELDAAIKEKGGDDGNDGHSPNQTDILIHFVDEDGVELFHTEDQEAYVDVDNGERRETYNVRSKGFQRWLRGRFFEETHTAPNSESLQTAINTIEAKAIFKGKKRDVFLRVGTFDGRVYYDLGGDDWQCVEADKAGWRVISKPPVRFRRVAGMKEQPIPKKGGSLDYLKEFLNFGSQDNFVLLSAWLSEGIRGHGPYPVIVLSGEQGSAKTTFSNILRSILDPNKSPSRALPRETRDLFIAANNAHVLAFDNVSSLQYWISDSLCRLSTGGSFATRQLNTDQDEVLFEATRPIILNGIEDIVTRPDLADRALFFTLEAIPEHQRRSEAELWRKFEIKKPYIFGALFDMLVEGLNRIDEIDLPTLPRMADFAEWGVATETALWKEGTFWNAYQSNRDDVIANVVESDVIASSVISLMANRNKWEGTATKLLEMLEEEAGEKVAKSKSFPKSPNVLSGRLRRAATFLRKLGIEMEHSKQGRAGKKIILIERADANLSVSPVAGILATAPTAPTAQPSNDKDTEWDVSM